MHGLPAGFDASFLVGLTLTRVCVGLHDVVLHLADNDRPPGLTEVLSEADVVIGDGISRVRHDDARTAGAGLLAFLGRATTAATGDTDGTLRLVFSDLYIEILDSEEHYESYVITAGERTIVV